MTHELRIRARSAAGPWWLLAAALVAACLWPREVHAQEGRAGRRPAVEREFGPPERPITDPDDPRREELRELFRGIEVQALAQGGPLGTLPPTVTGGAAPIGPGPHSGPGALRSANPTDELLPDARDSIFKVVLPASITGTGYGEAFLVRLASAKVNQPRPLLVVFHKFGSTHNEIPINTVFFEQAVQRNWNLVAPMGASTKHFGSLESQINTELALGWLLENHGEVVDRSRVYGVGFSMGGGAALSFAARHQDPSWLPFAAVVNHTGGTDLTYTYVNDFAVQWILEFWFGGNAVDALFEYQRVSSLDFHPVSKIVDTTSDMARNLRHVAVRNFYVQQDPLAYLKTATQVFHNHLSAIGGQSELIVEPGSVHEWQSLDQVGACAWLDQFSYERPASGTALADRDGNWFDVHLTQEASGAFSPFDFDIDPGARRIALENTENVLELRLDLATHGIDPDAGDLEVVTQAADGLGDQLVITGFSQPPSTVLEGGLSSANWTWDPGFARLVLTGPDDVQGTTFTIVP
ncbi:MAG: alpha/beta hydrolase family protein [Planctomycetota bacterium]|jgi:S-formylglutathione hydrolase FrmB